MMAGARHLPRSIKNLLSVQGLGRHVAQSASQYKENLLSGSSIKGFTPDTAVGFVFYFRPL
jgi:hypothetical protein